jgi:hypothetical protein
MNVSKKPPKVGARVVFWALTHKSHNRKEAVVAEVRKQGEDVAWVKVSGLRADGSTWTGWRQWPDDFKPIPPEPKDGKPSSMATLTLETEVAAR